MRALSISSVTAERVRLGFRGLKLRYYYTISTDSSRHTSHPKKTIFYIRLGSEENLSAISGKFRPSFFSKNPERSVEIVQ
jgi:hypothetical protein